MSAEVVAGTPTTVPFVDVFARALRGSPCSVVGPDGVERVLPVATWLAEADAADGVMLAHCDGATLDIGCGPGRLAERLTELGHEVLGIDVVREAVLQTRARGVSALVLDVFERLPGEGRWRSALLADGNIGIGGDPVALLSRARELLHHSGRVVVEHAPPGKGLQTARAFLHCDGLRSRPFRWAVVGADAIEQVAVAAGLVVVATHAHAGRWFSVLEVRR